MESLELLVLCTMGVVISARPFAEHYLDMSHQFNNQTIYWPLGQIARFNLKMTNKVLGNTQLEYAGGDISAGEHGGTHMDSPYHFNPQGLKIGQIPFDQFRAPAAVIDIRRHTSKNPDYMASKEDFDEWEQIHGRLPEDAMLLFCTDWDKKWPNWNQVYGTTNLQDPSTMHYPGVDPRLIEWLLDNRKFVGVGIDTVSPDGSATISKSIEVHYLLSGQNRLILENVKGVCDIPRHGATLIMLPQKIEYGSGAPVRVVAVWGNNALHMADGAPGNHVVHVGLLLLAFVISRMI